MVKNKQEPLQEYIPFLALIFGLGSITYYLLQTLPNAIDKSLLFNLIVLLWFSAISKTIEYIIEDKVLSGVFRDIAKYSLILSVGLSVLFAISFMNIVVTTPVSKYLYGWIVLVLFIKNHKASFSKELDYFLEKYTIFEETKIFIVFQSIIVILIYNAKYWIPNENSFWILIGLEVLLVVSSVIKVICNKSWIFLKKPFQ